MKLHPFELGANRRMALGIGTMTAYYHEFLRAGYPPRAGKVRPSYSRIDNDVFNHLITYEEELVMSDIPDPVAREDLPDPTGEYVDFIIGLMKINGGTSMLDYRNAAKASGGQKNVRLWVVCVGQHIAEARIDGIIDITLFTTPENERINGYFPKDEARVFWQNGEEEKMTPQQILEGWRAMRSITEDASDSTAAT